MASKVWLASAKVDTRYKEKALHLLVGVAGR